MPRAIPSRLSPFLAPIAHRGLHDAATGRIENSASAFHAAVAAGVGIECDVQAAAGDEPIVFHDETLDRLIGRPDAVADLSAAQLSQIAYPGTRDRIIPLADLFAEINAAVPLMVEIKTVSGRDWRPLADRVIGLASAYRGPVALKSFDTDLVAHIKTAAPTLPRGLVAADLRNEVQLADDRARVDRMAHLLDSGPADPMFVSYRASDLPNPVVRYVRDVVGLPVFTWTIRDLESVAAAKRWADAPIFEALAPDDVKAAWTS
ncbi:MAG: glycerophosphodiester phosphodiesterase family protein [Pseudomonadota bacterium]